jgi:hypothetical protein
MLTKDQASVVAEQFIVEARARSEAKVLKRLEARGGAMPSGISIAQFSDLVAKAESRVYRQWPLVLAAATWVILIAVEVHYHATALIAGSIAVGVLLLRVLGRKLVIKYIRDNVPREGLAREGDIEPPPPSY